MKYTLELELTDKGVTRIKDNHPGIYRVNIGDEILFFFDDAYFLKISGTLIVPNTEYCWTVPGPYLLILKEREGDHVVEEECVFWDPASVIVVNPAVDVSSLKMLTVMPRRLGLIGDWPACFSNIASRGYNAVHLTPVQTPGESHSGYSIADPFAVDPLLFSQKGNTNSSRWNELGDAVKSSGLFVITDVVLNHASNTSDWISSDSTYSLSQCPYLFAAFELDQTLSEKFDHESDSFEDDLYAILTEFKFGDFFKISTVSSNKNIGSMNYILTQLGTSREGIAVNGKITETIQLQLDQMLESCFNSVLNACVSTIRYDREICKIRRPLPRYFSQLANGDWALNNGWVMNWPAGCDFAAPGPHLVWLQRQVVVWEDCVKLRYTENVWSVMEKYTSEIALRFQGIRIDNCHSTPLFVLRRILRVMRSVNPNLVVMAELFVGHGGNEREYEASLGLDLLVREAMQIGGPWDWPGVLYNCKTTCLVPSSFPVTLLPTQNSAILYDATHDNCAVAAKFGHHGMDALPISVLVCAAPCAIGSSVGFDTLARSMPSVVCPTLQPDLITPLAQPGVWYPEACEVFADWNGWSESIRLFPNQNVSIPNVDEFKFKIANLWISNKDIGIGRNSNNILNTCGTLFDLKKKLNDLHSECLKLEFAATYTNNCVQIVRQDPETLEGYVFLIRLSGVETGPIELALDTELERIVLAAELNAEGQLVHWNKADMGYCEMSKDRIFLEKTPTVVILKLAKSHTFTFPPNVPLDEFRVGSDYSFALFGCASEEPCYDIPGHGSLVFAGFAGIRNLELDENIKRGDWLFDFVTKRIEKRFPKLFNYLNFEIGHEYRQLAPKLKPVYFKRVFDHVYKRLVEKIASGDAFYKSLVIASYQFTARPSVAAGLPHFASGYMRCWGRDTFISFKGLFLVTRRWEEARTCLLSFASVARHGLIPNLFDDGQNPRYNARDAVWCFLNSVCNYIDFTGDVDFMSTKIRLKYVEHAFWNNALEEVTMEELFIGLLRSHWEGIDFVEWNAGPAIDEYMQTEGFNVSVFVEKKTGLVYGGNAFNCGTWMDKMGSSHNGNRGIPATPRYGAAIEINAIALKVLSWLSEKKIQEEFISKWYENLSLNFFSKFCESSIFKDTVGGNDDFAFRPNACWALAIIPIEFVEKRSAQIFLNKCKTLVGPLGMKTLDPQDVRYNGVYDNNDESRGYNYHNGPEWGWLVGYYLIACKRFEVGSEKFPKIEKKVNSPPWFSLPELTNKDAAFCPYSCPSQAWSVCTYLEYMST